jgi:Mn-containing catalase
MYLHVQRLINEIEADEPDPAAANALQEGLGGQFGEMRTMMQYLFQAINFRGPQGKPYKDLLQGIGTEEISHVELIGTTIARLLDGSPRYNGKATDPLDKAGSGGATRWSRRCRRATSTTTSSPRRARCPVDAAGNPWSGSYVYNSGNLVLDLLYNLMLESTGPAAEVPDLRDDRQQDRALDHRLPDRAGPGARERLRQGARDARRRLGQDAADPEDHAERFPEVKKLLDLGCRTSSTASTWTTCPRPGGSSRASRPRVTGRSSPRTSRCRRACR